MLFIVLLSIFLSVNAENGYGYEVEVEPLKDMPEEPESFSATPTGGYTFLGFGGKKAQKHPGNQPALDTGSVPEMRLGLNTDPRSKSSDTRYVMDVVLVLDSSYSITQNGWSKLKEAAKKLIDGLDISTEGTHVSIIKYSTDVESYYMFDASATKEKLKQMIDDLQFDGQWSRTDLALQSVDRIVLAPMGGARLGNVPKKVILFSDGKSDGPTPPEEDIDWQERVEEQLEPLRNKNVSVFSVAAGEPNMTALAAISGSSARVFNTDNVDNLVAAVDSESLQIPLTESSSPSPSVTATATATATAMTTSTLAPQDTRTATEIVTLTTAIATTPVTTVIRTETQTNLITATETALTVISNTQTNTITETVTATATQSLTSTAIITATSTVTATATATEVVTLTTTVGVTSTSYAKALATPIPITIVGSVQGKKKRNKVTRTKRWYENYLPQFIHRWMGIVE